MNYFVQGLKPEVREVVSQKVRQMSEEDRVGLSAVRKVAYEVGR